MAVQSLASEVANPQLSLNLFIMLQAQTSIPPCLVILGTILPYSQRSEASHDVALMKAQVKFDALLAPAGAELR